MTNHEKKWTGRSHGSAFGYWLVHLVARYGGVTVCYLFIIPPTIVLFLRLHERRRLCMRYWHRLRPSLGRWGQTLMAWRHFYSFARQLADRFLIGVLTRYKLGRVTHKDALFYLRMLETGNSVADLLMRIV